jgi:hypothetical protein
MQFAMQLADERSKRVDDFFIFLTDRTGTLGTSKFLGDLKGGRRIPDLRWIHISAVWSAYPVCNTIVTKILQLVQS